MITYGRYRENGIILSQVKAVNKMTGLDNIPILNIREKQCRLESP